ncbi:DUF4376 domain-containing protein [Burkholderia gladioli]|uniref:DUF4376 domain-containing protein n=1 Tax=Burkholderia gladioli TaxID=28095 RepID=UPI00163FC833|nr:DUF4376 domain-containing protein [Burkholderia gladioli]
MGQKSAAYLRDTGAIIGFYDIKDSPAPDGVLTIDITDEQWQTCLAQTGQWCVENGMLAAVTQSADAMLAAAQADQMLLVNAAYATAVQLPVTFKTAAGVSAEFDADAASQTMLMQATQGYQIAGSVPPGFYWVAADNTRVTMALVDLQGLYQAMLAQGWAAFQKRQELKANIAAATTVEAVQAVSW